MGARDEQQRRSMTLYVGMMEEVKTRIQCIDQFQMGAFKDAVPAQLAREICFIQLRMIFEIVSIAILVIHRDHHDIKRLEKEWNANNIMPAVEKLNPNFFPHTVSMPMKDGSPLQVIDIEPHPLTKDGFLMLYGQCGNELHRGTLRKLTILPKKELIEFADIAKITQSVADLLKQHRISSSDLGTHYLCSLNVIGTPVEGFLAHTNGPIKFGK
jgi:hypothetical protein